MDIEDVIMLAEQSKSHRDQIDTLEAVINLMWDYLKIRLDNQEQVEEVIQSLANLVESKLPD
jgi:hypothetical protein